MQSGVPERWPENATFELTVRCNLRCKMCLFRHERSEDAFLIKNELTADQWIDMAKQAAEMGTAGLLITGGEPMLRSDFSEIYEGIYKQGFIIELYTNATLVNNEIMDLFRRLPPHKIGITVYGASAETYRKVCGDSDAFKRMIDGVHSLMELPSELEFRTTIIKDNLADADEMEELIHREFGEKYPLIQTRMVMKAVRGGCADVESCRISAEDNVRLAYRRSINKIKSIVGDRFEKGRLRLKFEDKNSDNACRREKISLLGCGGGMDSYTVTWDGKLQACQVLGAFQTDALKDGLRKAWELYPYQVKHPPLDEKCVKCKLAELCQTCPASRYAETGSIGGAVEYACRDAEEVNKMMVNNLKGE